VVGDGMGIKVMSTSSFFRQRLRTGRSVVAPGNLSVKIFSHPWRDFLHSLGNRP
jgi:hypothetical protein